MAAPAGKTDGLQPMDVVNADEVASTLRLHLAGMGLLEAAPAPAAAPAAALTGKAARAAAFAAASKPKPVAAPARPGKAVPTQPVEDPNEPLIGDPGVTKPAGPASHEKFYITTAINYTNGNPHIGHAYEAVTSDMIARYQRVYGREVFFLTGTDEHGQKVAATAEGLGLTPIQLCDKYAGNFQALNRKLRISNDFFVRTTQPKHYLSAQELWKRCAAAGDIYLDKYEGWYNVREETFVTEAEAKLSDFKDLVSGVPLKKMEETSYFFRMSKYQARLLEHIKASPHFILPESRRNLILARMEEELMDLSVSRTTFDWGIPVPPGFEPGHVLYVWFDALSNYLSGIDFFLPESEAKGFWPAGVHVIGKDIIWFHCVIWPTILMSAGLPLPKSVFAHGFIHDKEGRKMSKSLGNVVDPHAMIAKFPVDSFRFYLAKDPFGGDINFNEEALLAVHNNELADVLGNLVHRAVNLCHKYCDGQVPPLPTQESSTDPWGGLQRPFDLEALRAAVEGGMQTFALKTLCEEAMAGLRETNKFLTEAEPWKMKGDERAEDRKRVVRLTLEAVYVLAHFLAPIMPYSATAIFKKLGNPPQPIPTLQASLVNLKTGSPVEVGDILFVKIDAAILSAPDGDAAAAPIPAIAAPAKPAKGVNGGDGGKQQQQKKEKQPKQGSGKGGKAAAAAAAEEEVSPDNPNGLRIVVGRIVKAWQHPDSEKLWCEEIDVGEAAPRQIASGLRQFYPEASDLEGRKVLVLANLKARKLGGFPSHGMVLCASNAAHTEVKFVEVPASANVGARVIFEGEGVGPVVEPLEPNKLAKRKVFETVAPDLVTDAEGVCRFKGAPFAIAGSGEVCTAPLPNAHVS